MFGMKINPLQMVGMLKNFGFDLEKQIPEFEKKLITEAAKLEQEAGAPLMAVIVVSEEKTHMVISLYKNTGGGGLDLWKSFPFSDILKLLQNAENEIQNAQSAPSPEPIATIAAPTDTTGTAAGPYGYTGNNDTGSGTDIQPAADWKQH